MKQEHIDRIREMIGERTDDDALALLEIINDTEEQNEAHWEQKYHDNDNEWRKRYADRFNTAEIKTSIIKESEDDEREKELERISKLRLSDFF